MITRDGSRIFVESAITLATAVAVLEKVAGELGQSEVIVDLERVPEVDSAALAVMLEWMRRAQRDHAGLQFENLPKNLQALAELYGLLDLVPVRSA